MAEVTPEVSPTQQTQNIADGLEIAVERLYDRIEPDGRLLSVKMILDASVEIACKRLTELQARLDATERYLESQRHHDRSCSLEAQGYDQLECAEIGTADSLANHALCVLRGQVQT